MCYLGRIEIMPRAPQHQAKPTSEQRMDALAIRIRDKLQDVLERNVEKFIDHIDDFLAPNAKLDHQKQPRQLAAPKAAKPAASMANRYATSPRDPNTGKLIRRCKNCRQTGHRSPNCPNPKVESSDDDSEPPAASGKPKRIVWDEQQRLIKLVQETGNRQAIDHLIRSNVGLVHRVARKCPWHIMPYDDVVQEGMIGLMKGILKFDLTRGLRLSTYATWWIKHQIIRAHEDGAAIRMPARYGSMLYKMGKAAMPLQGRLGREPTAGACRGSGPRCA
jgi:RNA polymerase primary sigma factor